MLLHIHDCLVASYIYIETYFCFYAGIVEFFFFDTTPFQDKYFTEEDHKYDWRGVLPRDKYLSNALKVSFIPNQQLYSFLKIYICKYSLIKICQNLLKSLAIIKQFSNISRSIKYNIKTVCMYHH